MSNYHTIITQLQWIKLSSMEAKGGTVVSPIIQETIQSIQTKIRSDIRTNITNAPLSLEIVKSLLTHIPQRSNTSMLWKELKENIDVLLQQAQLLDTLVVPKSDTSPESNPTVLKPTVKKVKKTVATSPFSPTKEDVPQYHLTLFLPKHLSFVQLELESRLKDTRTNIAIEYGYSIPKIDIQQSDDLHYTLCYRQKQLGQGHIPESPFFALAPKEHALEDNLDVEPAYGKKGIWLGKNQSKENWRVISPTLILESHVHEILIRNIHVVFDWNSFHQIIAQLEENHVDLLNKVIPSVLTRKQLFDIYTALLHEDVPINNQEALLKTIYAFRTQNKGTQFLVERIRRRLFDPNRIDANYQYATLSKPFEKLLRQALTRSKTKESFKIDDAVRSRIIQTITELSQQSSSVMLLIVPPPLRPAMQLLITPHNLRDVRVLSTDDLNPITDRLFAELTLNEVLYR